MTSSQGKRRFHFKNTLPQDPDVQRFGDWPPANRGFYDRFRHWLKDCGYSPSAINIYSVAARQAIGFLRKPYWQIDPDLDIRLVKAHMRQRISSLSTCKGYQKGLGKLDQYLRFTVHRPEKPKEVHWDHYIGKLSIVLQTDVREFIHFCQHSWKEEQRFERTISTLSHLTKSLRWMAEHASLNEIADLTPQAWYAYLDMRVLAGIKPRTINCELSALKHLVLFLREHERQVCERFLLVECLDDGYCLPKDVPIKQLRVLQQSIQELTSAKHSGLRRTAQLDLAWFLLMLHSGLRTAEIRNLKLKDIEWDAHRIRIERSKGLKDRMVYMSQAVMDALHSYLEVRGPAEALPEYVFIYHHRPLSKTYCHERLQSHGNRCGVRVSPHQLRHSCATLLLNAGAPIVTVQTILGHKNVDTTLGYARLYDGTVAADYYQAMIMVERQLALPEDQLIEVPSVGEMLALVDSLRKGTLTPAQTEIVWALRSALTLLAGQEFNNFVGKQASNALFG